MTVREDDFRLIAFEFGDDTAMEIAKDLPTLDDRFNCRAWHNDTCPKFVASVGGAQLWLWIERRAEGDREYTDAKRYTLQAYANETDAYAGVEVQEWETDSGTELQQFVADAFTLLES